MVGSRTYPVTKQWWDEVLDDEGRAKVEKDGRKIVRSVLRRLTPGSKLVSGGAKGPDSWAKEAAEDFSHEFVEIRPNWKKYGKGAGFKRNKEIIAASDDLIAFWDLESNGTWHSIKLAAKAEMDMVIFGPDGKLFFWATQEDYKGEPGLLEMMIKRKLLKGGTDQRTEHPSPGQGSEGGVRS